MTESPSQIIQIIEQMATELFSQTPTDLSEIDLAMSYSLLAGGKRIRALIPCLVAEAHKKNWRSAIYPALALECVHTYSLIHDDLPCMDNDDVRRGKPTNHKVFGEATALLAGDALLTEAFRLLSKGYEQQDYSAEQTVTLMKILSTASGRYGMIGGQILDMQAEKNRSIERLQRMHSLKTGAILEAAFHLGAVLANQSDLVQEQWQQLGQRFGQFFQIQDDLLDAIGDAQQLGKTTGKDAEKHKWTYTECYGVERTQQILEDEYILLQQQLANIQADTSALSELFARLKNRNQ
mgnify:FL=1